MTKKVMKVDYEADKAKMEEKILKQQDLILTLVDRIEDLEMLFDRIKAVEKQTKRWENYEWESGSDDESGSDEEESGSDDESGSDGEESGSDCEEEKKVGSRTCGQCHTTGHNKRICPELTKASVPSSPTKSPTKKKRKVSERHCSLCKETGHTKRTCTSEVKVKDEE